MQNINNSEKTAPKNVIAVIVTYNIQDSFVDNINSLYNQVNSVIIVDNGSGDESLTILKEIELKYKDVIVIRNKKNLGLSKAQNIGIRKALDNKSCKWVLLLDDDSSLDRLMISKMLSAYKNNEEKDNVALITPRIRDINNGRDYPCLMKKNNFMFKRYFLPKTSNIDSEIESNNGEKYKNGLFCALASGSLIKREVFEDIGLMNEAYFIDFIDWDFAIRLQKSGRIIMCASNAILFHRLGNKTTHFLLGKEFVTTNQPSYRRFTSCRNRVLFIRNNIFNSPAIILYICASMSYEMILIILFEKNRFRKLLEMLKGTFSGIVTINTDVIPKL